MYVRMYVYMYVCMCLMFPLATSTCLPHTPLRPDTYLRRSSRGGRCSDSGDTNFIPNGIHHPLGPCRSFFLSCHIEIPQARRQQREHTPTHFISGTRHKIPGNMAKTQDTDETRFQHHHTIPGYSLASSRKSGR